MNTLKEMLLAKQETLRSKLNESKSMSHPTSKGDNSEDGWMNFIKEMLPNKYGICKGFVIDYLGNVSEQIDIIIYDALYSPYIMSSSTKEIYVPAEAVYAVIEVKQQINKNYLKYANDKVESVKKLKRTSRGVMVAGEKRPKRKLTDILGIILAKETGIKRDATLKKYLEELKNINIVCALDEYTVLCERKEANLEMKKTNENEAILGLYFYLNNELYELGTVAGIDIREYANTLDSFNFNTEEDFRGNE